MLLFMAGSDSGEKTEKGTPKKRRDTRERGQVLKSQELTTAVMLTASFMALKFFGGGLVQGLEAYFTRMSGFDYINTTAVDIALLSKVVSETMLNFLLFMLPFLGVAFISALVVNYVQVGFLFTTKPLMPKFSKLNPIQGFKRIFSLKAIFELAKTTAKIAIIGFVVYSGYMAIFGKMPYIMNLSIGEAALYLVDSALGIAFQAAIALFGIGIADYLYQWYDYEKNLRMTKQEIKEETKMIEGDPKIKGAIKQKQREMSMRRMMQAVPTADVVITNPTHYAIALKYDESKSNAPMCVAKGKDHVAQRIKEIARENKVEIVENKPLAQALYVTVEVDREISGEFFQAVAEILAYVYKVKRRV